MVSTFYNYNLDFFRAIASRNCESKEYTLSFASKTSTGEEVNESFKDFTTLDSENKKISFSPTLNAQKGSYVIPISVYFTKS